MIVKLLSDLVSFKTVTPNGDAAIEYCAQFLEKIGFFCHKLNFGSVANLYDKYGTHDKNICFAGHVDVVPPLDGWNSDPFVLTERDGLLFGRGTNDMKGGLAAGLCAISAFLKKHTPDFSVSVILTSDEEIMGKNGTSKIVQWLQERNEQITGCILCESCSPDATGEYIKIGCRGSLNVDFKSVGTQCHVVSSKRFGNHLHSFAQFISDFAHTKLDDGNSNFSPSNIEMTSIDVANSVRNIIPANASAKFNIRFNDCWTFEKLEHFIKKQLPQNISVKFTRFGFPFIGSDTYFTNFLAQSINKTLGTMPKIGTAGGNSDALSLHKLTNVVEIGTPIENAHIVNEYVSKTDLEKLYEIYFDILGSFSAYCAKHYSR